MKTSQLLFSLLSCAVAVACLSGCSTTSGERPNMALGGMGAGLAAGAIVGGTTNMNTASAMAIGAGAGLLTGAIVDVYGSSFESTLNDNDAAIQQNADTIAARQIELDRFREEVNIETADTTIDTSENNYLYVGPSLGSYTR